MPELPDVETFRRYLDATSLHKKIEKVEVKDSSVLKEVSTGRFSSSVRGREFESSDRLGKYMFVRMDNGMCIMMHFGMTGFLKYFRDREKAPPHTRILFNFSNDYSLAYDCQRKLGRVRLTDSVGAIAEEKDLGVDALDPELDLSRFLEIMSERRGMIKTALMNQSVIAGIGNIYSDEILFQGRVHPERQIREISREELKKLYMAMKRVLKKTIQRKADPGSFPRSYLIPRREEGKNCPRCGGDIDKIKVNNRGTYLCPECQK